jgi:hypothetical protein
MSTDIPGAPEPAGLAPAPAPRKVNWWLIGGIVGALVLCACIVCVASPFLMATFAPSIGAQFTGTLCTIQYPDLTADQCNKWAQDVWTNHQSEFIECQNSANAAGSSSNANALFKCLDDKGIGPKSK